MPSLNYFLTLKKYHVNKCTFLSLNPIMRIYSNAYNCAIYLKLLVFFARFKHTVKKYDHCAYILIIIKRFYHLDIYNKKIYKKNLPIWYKKIVFVYGINM